MHVTVHPPNRASFLGAYRLVPPFQSPTGCPDFPACGLHGRPKHGCQRCEDIARQSAAVAADDGGEPEDGRPPMGWPLPPAKFYTRAMVSWSASPAGRRSRQRDKCVALTNKSPEITRTLVQYSHLMAHLQHRLGFVLISDVVERWNWQEVGYRRPLKTKSVRN